MKTSLSEKILFSLFIITLLINLFLPQIPGKNLFFVLFTSVLSYYYFSFGFAVNNGLGFRKMFQKKNYQLVNGGEIAISIVLGLSFAFALNAFLFKIMLWPGAVMMSVVAIIFIAISLVLILTINTNKKKQFIIRTTPFLILSTFAFAVPNKTMSDFKYRHLSETCKEWIQIRRNFKGNFIEYAKLQEQYKECEYPFIKKD